MRSFRDVIVGSSKESCWNKIACSLFRNVWGTLTSCQEKMLMFPAMVTTGRIELVSASSRDCLAVNHEIYERQVVCQVARHARCIHTYS